MINARLSLLLSYLAMVSAACAPASAPQKDATRETVVLLHGMGRSRASLWMLEHRLKSAGYDTLNFPYVPQWNSVDEVTRGLHAYVAGKVRTKRYHLIGHSLGNIIIRNGFKEGYPPGLGRIVMLAPPNQPAALAKRFRDQPLYRLFTGDSGRKLASEAFYKQLPVPSVPFGIIAGDKGQHLTFNEANDGVVTVASTKLEGMQDWIVVHHTHTFMMNSRDTAEYCVNFLKTGRWQRTR